MQRQLQAHRRATEAALHRAHLRPLHTQATAPLAVLFPVSQGTSLLLLLLSMLRDSNHRQAVRYSQARQVSVSTKQDNSAPV